MSMQSSAAREGGARPFVSVLVPHYDVRESLLRCLASLAAQTYPASRFEIIVADNATPGGVGDVARGLANVAVLTVEDRGAAPARNAAMAAARGEVFAFIDADCAAAPGWIEAGVRGLRHADYSGGRIEVTCVNARAPSPVEAFERVFAFRQKMYVERKHFSATANLFVTRSAAEAIGPFRKGVGEDFDWGRRAHALGLRLAFNDNPVVEHPARRDWRELVRKWDRLTVERWNGLAGAGMGRALKWSALAAATAASPAAHLWPVLASRRLQRPSDRMAAAGVLARIRLWRARRMLALLLQPRGAQEAGAE